MDGLARLWLVAADGGAPAPRRVETLARLLAPRRPDALACRPGDAAGAALAAALELRCIERAGLGDADAALEVLADLARAHDGGALLCSLAPPAFARALAAALELERAEGAFAPAPLQLAAVDWPSGRLADARPALVGLDLDWLPPWSPGPPRRFPGGPGVAASPKG